ERRKLPHRPGRAEHRNLSHALRRGEARCGHRHEGATVASRSGRFGRLGEPSCLGEPVHLGEPERSVRLGGLDRTGDDVDGPGQDRKSTRLNSSHVSTSYAVFCLKKKNTCKGDADTAAMI